MIMNGVFGILDEVEVPMRDGTILRATIWLPGGFGTWPVLLQRTPYRKEDPFGTQHISALEFQTALRRGYAVMVQDTRGRFASDGDFDPFVHEASDGVDTVAWLREQKFCDGRVAMFGASYVGATQVLAAIGNPNGLLAIAPQLTTARHGETWMYRGGALELGFVLLWLLQALGPEDLGRRWSELPPEVAERSRNLLQTMHRDADATFARLPVLHDDLVELGPYMKDWLDPARKASAARDADQLNALYQTEAAMLVIGGLNDLFVEGSIELFEAAISRWPNGIKGHDRLILGPWSHGNPLDWQGDEWLGYGASTFPVIAEHLAFFDDVLNGRDPQSPLVRYFRGGSKTWHAAQAWPLPGTEITPLYLTSEHQLAWEVGENWIGGYLADPANPVPTVGGATFLPGLILGRNSGPKEQCAVEARADVMVFTSGPLEQAIEVTGCVVAKLWVDSAAPTCDWTVRLCEVMPDGRSVGRVDGILRWTKPDSLGPHEVSVRLGHLSHLFGASHRLRIQIASSNFPRFDRNPQCDIASVLAGPSDLKVAQQSLFGGSPTPSRILLPQIANPDAGVTEFDQATL